MKNDQWLVCIPVGKWQLSGIKKAKELGFKIYGMDGDPNAEGRNLCDEFSAVDIKNSVKVLNLIIQKKYKISGVLSLVSEAGMIAAANIREEFGLFGPNKGTTIKLTDKIEQRRTWEQTNIPIPFWSEFSNQKQALHGVNKIGLPCVVKPADSAGSRGVSVVEKIEEIEKAISEALKFSYSNKGLVEQYIKGIEYAVETFGSNGDHLSLCVTQKSKVPGTRGTVANELYTPENTELSDRLGELACRSLLALGYNDGPGHTEIIVSDSGDPFLVEAAGRGGGFKLFESFVPKISNFDIQEATIKQASRFKFELPLEVKKNFGCLLFIPSIAGRVISIKGIEDAYKLPGVEIGLLVDVGSQVSVARSDGDRLAYIIAIGNNLKESRDMAHLAKDLIKFEIEEGSNVSI